MHETILKKLKEIEEKENIRILHCVESGSRAWGFASPDSDYDVRFIYVRPKDYYLRLDETRDVIEWQLDDTLDINGWDLQKALRLLYKSNSTLFEWNNSPIIYMTTKEWQTVSSVIHKYFQTKNGLYHYLSTAQGNYREYLKGNTVKLKKYFYVLRPILACKWIISEGTPPPMLFSTLVDRCLDEEIKDEVAKLLELKKTTSELGQGQRIDIINDYIDKSLLEINDIIARIPNSKANAWDELNNIFLSIVNQ